MSKVDVVAVLRMDTMEQVFAAARPMSAQVFKVANAMEHPLEDGSTVTDHIIFLPVEIELPLMVTGDVETVISEIDALYRSAELLVVQTVSGSYENMFIRAMPHDEKAESIGSATIGLQLKQAVFVKAILEGGLAPAQVTPATPPANTNRRPAARASTAARGAQQTTTPTAPTAARGSTLYRLFGGGG